MALNPDYWMVVTRLSRKTVVPTIDLENIWDPRNIFFSSKFFRQFFEIYIFSEKNASQTSYLVYRLGYKTSTVEHDVGYPTVTAIELENI